MPEGVDGPVRANADIEPPEWLTDERKQNMEQHIQNNLDAWKWEKSRYIEALQTKYGLSRTDALLFMVWQTFNVMVITQQQMREEAITLSKRGLTILEKLEEEMDDTEGWRKDDA